MITISYKYQLSVIYLKQVLGTKWMLRQKRHKEGNLEKGVVIMLPKSVKYGQHITFLMMWR